LNELQIGQAVSFGKPRCFYNGAFLFNFQKEIDLPSLIPNTEMQLLSKLFFFLFLICFSLTSAAQEGNDSIIHSNQFSDSALRIINVNPYFTIHVDSMLTYRFDINRYEQNYFWFLKNAPLGLKINKDNGQINFKAEKSFFLSGKLKYDTEYKVNLGVQSLSNPSERVDTTITIVIYNTEIQASKLKPTVIGTQYINEGETVSFRILCESGNFPIENILFSSNTPINNYQLVKLCGDEFKWSPDYEFVKDTDSAKLKIVQLSFIGSTRFSLKDTATVRIIVRDALNYPILVEENKMVVKNIRTYILQLKYTFLQLDRKLKRVKSTRTGFDLTTASTALTGTILNTSSSVSSQKTGKVLPSVGVAIVPIKEVTAPNKIVDQNQASQIRTSIKRLEYVVNDNLLVGEKDPDIQKKNNKLREELKQSQMQLIDIPIEIANSMTEVELNNYFNSPKVNKKYRLKKR
jgi:hypothetical protein